MRDHFNKKLIISNFILSLMVVTIHIIDYTPEFKYSNYIIFLLFESLVQIGNIAVPIFFMLSGFKFYLNYTPSLLIDKYKRRIKTLIVPYFIWNIITYIFYYFFSRSPIYTDSVINFNICDFIISIINSTYSPMWFIRTLVVYCLVSPLIIMTWKNDKISILWIVILVLSNYIGIRIPIISNYYLPIFLLGAHFAIYKKDFIFESNIIKTSLGILGMIIIVGISLLYDVYDLGEKTVLTIRILGVFSFWFSLDIFSFNIRYLMPYTISMPIFCMHVMIVKAIKSIWYQFYNTFDLLTGMMFITTSLLITVLAIEIFCYICRKYFQTLYKVLFGYR